MDQNGTKDNNGHDLNEKKLPEDPVSLYIVSFFLYLIVNLTLFQPEPEPGDEIFSHGFDANHVRRAFVRKGIGSTLHGFY